MGEGSNATVTIDDTTVMFNDATVRALDVPATNGIIHVIDGVLIPPDNDAVKALIETCSIIKDIPGTAVANKLDTLVTVLKKADLVDILSGDALYTVFAPTDDAFAKLDAGVLACLQQDTYKAELADVLKYHVTSGKVPSSALKNGAKVTTLEGSDATVTIDGMTVMVNDATVTIPDVPATNGIIHVIDVVLIPPDNDDINALIVKYGPKSASAIVGVVIPLIGMVAAVAAIV